jgi:hypothetical protein
MSRSFHDARIARLVLSGLLFLGTSGVAVAATTSLQTAFDWQTQWGTIDFASPNDPVIPASQLPPKRDIKNAVKTYGTLTTQAALSLIKTYTVDIDGDGIQDIVLDASSYFQTYANETSSLCTDGYGCYLSIYIVSSPTDIIVAPSATNAPASGSTIPGAGATSGNACPTTASGNTMCRSDCPATPDNCPGLFQYNMTAVYDGQVLGWNFISAADFTSLVAASPARAAIYIHGTAIYTINSNPVLAVTLNDSSCYQEEINANGNQCVKYYQFTEGTPRGAFVDLYVPQPSAGSENDTRFTYIPFDRNHYFSGRGMVMGTGATSGYGHKLSAGGTLDEQIASFVRTNTTGATSSPAFAAFHIENHSTSNYFVPANTDAEFSSFLNHPPAGVTIAPAELQFTPWTGGGTCPTGTPCTNVGSVWYGGEDSAGAWRAAVYSCGSATTAAQERFCQNSTSAYRDCSECINAKVSDYQNACYQAVKCSPIVITIGSIRDCLAGAARISLPEGKTKRLNQMKAGETVLGFDTLNGELKPVKVTAVAVTKNERTIKINGMLALTEDHGVVTGEGKPISAGALKVGDTLVLASGKTMKVKSLKALPDKGIVYNLQLENGVGFVAGGVRVLSMSDRANEP